MSRNKAKPQSPFTLWNKSMVYDDLILQFYKSNINTNFKCFSNTLFYLVLKQNDHCRNTVIRRNSILIIIKSKVTFISLCVLMRTGNIWTQRNLLSFLGIILSFGISIAAKDNSLSTWNPPEETMLSPSKWIQLLLSRSNSFSLPQSGYASELTFNLCHSKSKGSKDKEN